MNPKKSDFGMARIFGEKQSEANTTDGVVGHCIIHFVEDKHRESKVLIRISLKFWR